MDTDTMHFKKGFTIVELIVVIAIILLLLSIVLASIMLARQDGRDKRRVSDLSNIAHAMTLYKEKHREYPDAGTGIEIGKRTTASERALDDEIKALNGNTYSDPLGGSGYGYVFYSRFFCGGERVNMVVVKKMEKEDNGNYEDVCGPITKTNAAQEDKTFALTPLVPVAHAGGGGGGGGSAVCTLVISPASVLFDSPAAKSIRFNWDPGTYQPRSLIGPGVNMVYSEDNDTENTTLYDADLSSVPRGIHTYKMQYSKDGTNYTCKADLVVTSPTTYSQSSYVVEPAIIKLDRAAYVMILRD